MKKVILGVGMLFSGVIGVVGIIMAVVIPGTGAYGSDWGRAMIDSAGLLVPFLIFALLAISGLLIAIRGVLESK